MTEDSLTSLIINPNISPVVKYRRGALVPGARVSISLFRHPLSGMEGTIIEAGTLNDRDCTVKLDDRESPLGFYEHEVTVLDV